MITMETLLQVSLTCALVILAVLFFSTLAGAKIAAKYRCFAWMAIAVRLLLPFKISLPSAPVQVEHPSMNTPIYIKPSHIPDRLQNSPNISNPIINSTAISSLSWMDVVFYIWVIGAILIAFYEISSYFFTRRKMLRWSLSADSDLQKTLTSVCQELQIKKPFILLVSKTAETPMMMGLFASHIILPDRKYSNAELRFIIQHELTHYQRKDIWLKLVLLSARTVHWFNPFVYLMTNKANSDIECACDDRVVEMIGLNGRRAYSETILSAACTAKIPVHALTTHFYSGKKSLVERIKNIMNTSKRRISVAVVALALILISASGLLIGFSAKAVATENNYVAEHFAPLLALRIDGYQNMSVNEYRDYALQIIDKDPDTYNTSLDTDDTYLYENRYSDPDASFIVNTLFPICAEKWESRDFPNWVQNPYSKEPAIEYSIRLEVLDPQNLTVGQYEKSYTGMMEDIQSLVVANCSETAIDETAINDGLTKLEEKHSNDSIKVSMQDKFLRVVDNVPTPENSDGDETTPASENDYKLVLSLYRKGYENQSVAEFTSYIKDAFTADDSPIHQSYERVYVDLQLDRVPKTVTDSDIQFLFAVENSIREYVAEHQSSFADETIYPSFRGYYFGEGPEAIVVQYDYFMKVLDT